MGTSSCPSILSVLSIYYSNSAIVDNKWLTGFVWKGTVVLHQWGRKHKRLVFFFTMGPLSQFTTTERSWSSHLSKHVALCQFELRQRIADLLRQRTSAQNISLSTLIFMMVSFQVHGCNSQFNTKQDQIFIVCNIIKSDVVFCSKVRTYM